MNFWTSTSTGKDEIGTSVGVRVTVDVGGGRVAVAGASGVDVKVGISISGWHPDVIDRKRRNRAVAECFIILLFRIVSNH